LGIHHGKKTSEPVDPFQGKGADEAGWSEKQPNHETPIARYEVKDYRGERLIDVKAAAKLLWLKPSTFYQWAYQRRFPVVKLGRPLRFLLSDLQALIRRSASSYRQPERTPLGRGC